MRRMDLLVLTSEDLEVLSNRGTVKRSQRELDDNEVQFDLTEDAAGNIHVQWSDGITTRLSSDKMLKDCPCTCGAAGICRHIIRSVLAYQKLNASQESMPAGSGAKGGSDAEAPQNVIYAPFGQKQKAIDKQGSGHGGAAADADQKGVSGDDQDDAATAGDVTGAGATQMPVEPAAQRAAFEIEPWDPGKISDADMEKTVGAALMTRAKRLYSEGQIAELVRGTKPFVRFHTLSHSIRFMVPFDLRYARCDCADRYPCFHVPLAVMAFRLLKDNQIAGTVCTAQHVEAPQTELFQSIENTLRKTAAAGISALTMPGEIKRAIQACQEKELIWPAEILAELILEIERYQERDARYSSAHVVELIAETLIRFDAIRNNTGAIPVELIRGLKTDKASDITSTRLVGLGCGGTISRFGSSLTAYMQDVYSGNLITMRKDFIEKPDEDWRDLHVLAEKPALRALGLGQVGKGQILTKGGKLTPAREYQVGRAQFTFNHQSYQWELLRPPLAVDSFSELRAVAGSRFPSYVSPRYSGRNFYVCAVKEASRAAFNEREQVVEAVLSDREGEHAELIFPYVSIAAQGCGVLLRHLQEIPHQARFVAGHVRPGRRGLSFVPVALIFDDGNKRSMVQPWVDRMTAPGGAASLSQQAQGEMRHLDALEEFLARSIEELGSLFTLGFERLDSRSISIWQELSSEADSLGFAAIASAIAKLSDKLAEKPHQLNWNAAEAAGMAINLAVFILVAQQELVRAFE